MWDVGLSPGHLCYHEQRCSGGTGRTEYYERRRVIELGSGDGKLARARKRQKLGTAVCTKETVVLKGAGRAANGSREYKNGNLATIVGRTPSDRITTWLGGERPEELNARKDVEEGTAGYMVREMIKREKFAADMSNHILMYTGINKPKKGSSERSCTPRSELRTEPKRDTGRVAI